jgi:uncharacterized protein YceH (UPF0502 family)
MNDDDLENLRLAVLALNVFRSDLEAQIAALSKQVAKLEERVGVLEEWGTEMEGKGDRYEN